MPLVRVTRLTTFDGVAMETNFLSVPEKFSRGVERAMDPDPRLASVL